MSSLFNFDLGRLVSRFDRRWHHSLSQYSKKSQNNKVYITYKILIKIINLIYLVNKLIQLLNDLNLPGVTYCAGSGTHRQRRSSVGKLEFNVVES